METVSLIGNYSEEKYDGIYKREDVINLLNKEITRYIITGLGKEMDEKTSNNFAGYLRIVRDLERVGDHCKNIADSTKQMDEEMLSFSSMTSGEIESLRDTIYQIFETLREDLTAREVDIDVKRELQTLVKDVDNIRNAHMERMKTGVCNPESGLNYEKMLTAFDRIGSYLSNAVRLYCN